MSSTITVQETYNWAYGFVNFEPLAIASGNEPALTNANTVFQTILGPPFRWNWNRKTAPFTITVNTQDTVVALSDFGFIESASCTLAGSTFAIQEIKQELSVAASNDSGRPKAIAAQIDDNAGNITFRALPNPDAAYTVTVTYQKKIPSLLSALSSTWMPIPDQYSYIYNYGFLALAMAYADDPRFPMLNQKFVAHLLGTQQGLTETERNLFIDTWNLIARQEALMGIKTQQGRAALGT